MVRKMALPFLFIFFCAILAESSSDVVPGTPCNRTDGNPGFCTLWTNCSAVRGELERDNPRVDTLCGFDSQTLVVCCPTSTTTTTTSTSTTTTSIPPTTRGPISDGRGEIARQKCTEYAQSVYVWRRPPIPSPGVPRRKVSQCAIIHEKLIVGGVKAERKEFPHMAALGHDTGTGGNIVWFCGGTLISETFVLTAAHCTYASSNVPAAWVRVGDLNLAKTDDRAKPEDYRITERIRHPLYSRPPLYHDIALLRLERSVTFNDWVRPACLHTEPSTGTQKVVATGWGRVDWNDEGGSDDLLKVTMPLVDELRCNESYTFDVTLPNGVNGDWSICAGDLKRDTCQGDSGGPLVIYSKPEYFCMYDVVGITSLGKLCGTGTPGVYTRVYHYISWIENIVWGSHA